MKETYSRTKSVWQRMNEKERKAAMAYGERYKKFLDTARTERLAAAEIIRQAEAKGFKPVYDMKSLKAGDKVYWNQKGKSVILAVIGKEPVHNGIKIVGSHIDSPRLDLKANPVHEKEGIVYFRTHYYGGIKKYQWTTIPLALIGVVYTKSGKKVDIHIGMDEKDPVFYVSDLLIHMAQDQMKKTLAEGVTGEQLQAIAGTHSKEGQTPKEAIMALLKKEYGIEEEDFATAELELVPAMKSRDVGFDRSLIASYGQD
ncbi:MAG: aminopeptidase, partial [Dialister sp.]|nr:aminopeptidase [Dialister sp.]